MDSDYIKQIEESNEKLKQIAEETSELSDMFKYFLSKSTFEVFLDQSGKFSVTFNGSMLNDGDHRIKEIVKKYAQTQMVTRDNKSLVKKRKYGETYE